MLKNLTYGVLTNTGFMEAWINVLEYADEKVWLDFVVERIHQDLVGAVTNSVYDQVQAYTSNITYVVTTVNYKVFNFTDTELGEKITTFFTAETLTDDEVTQRAQALVQQTCGVVPTKNITVNFAARLYDTSLMQMSDRMAAIEVVESGDATLDACVRALDFKTIWGTANVTSTAATAPVQLLVLNVVAPIFGGADTAAVVANITGAVSKWRSVDGFDLDLITMPAAARYASSSNLFYAQLFFTIVASAIAMVGLFIITSALVRRFGQQSKTEKRGPLRP